MYKILCSLLFVSITFAYAAEDSYVFEAKGEFAKELKSLVEKYSKEGKIEAKVYKKEDIKQTKTITQNILSFFDKDTAEELKYADVKGGERLYQKNCASCHGVNADENSYATEHKLINLKPLKIIELLKGYKSNYYGTFGGSLRTIMKPQADFLLADEMQSIAVYIYSLKNDAKTPMSTNAPTKIEEETTKPTNYLQ